MLVAFRLAIVLVELVAVEFAALPAVTDDVVLLLLLLAPKVNTGPPGNTYTRFVELILEDQGCISIRRRNILDDSRAANHLRDEDPRIRGFVFSGELDSLTRRRHAGTFRIRSVYGQLSAGGIKLRPSCFVGILEHDDFVPTEKKRYLSK